MALGRVLLDLGQLGAVQVEDFRERHAIVHLVRDRAIDRGHEIIEMLGRFALGIGLVLGGHVQRALLATLRPAFGVWGAVGAGHLPAARGGRSGLLALGFDGLLRVPLILDLGDLAGFFVNDLAFDGRAVLGVVAKDEKSIWFSSTVRASPNLPLSISMLIGRYLNSARTAVLDAIARSCAIQGVSFLPYCTAVR